MIGFIGCSDSSGDTEQVLSPIIYISGGIGYWGDYFDVTITTQTDGAEIRYTTDGSTPTSTSGIIYSGSIPVYKVMTINAIAYGSGMSDSDVATSDLFSINPITSTIDSTNNVGSYTSIAVDGSNVYISYLDITNINLKFAKSEDGGASWLTSPAIDPVVDETNNVGEYTSIAVDGSNVYISYRDFTNGNLKFAKSTDGGATWE